MQINFILDTDCNYVSQLAEEAESNQSDFIKNLCSEILIQIAKETTKLEINLKEIKMVNPYGFPSV